MAQGGMQWGQPGRWGARGGGEAAGNALGRPSSVGMQKKRQAGRHTINIAKHMASPLSHVCVCVPIYIHTYIHM